MVKISFCDDFQKLFSKIKDSNLKQKIIKQLLKLNKNPELGKPMSFTRKGTRELYISPYRLSYYYDEKEQKIILLDLYKKTQKTLQFKTIRNG